MPLFKRKQSSAEESSSAVAEAVDSSAASTAQRDSTPAQPREQDSVADLIDRLEAADQLVPSRVARWLLENASETASAQQLAAIIGRDDPLSAEVAAFAASSLVGLPQQPATLEAAVAALGPARAHRVALAFSLISLQGRSAPPGFDYSRFRSQSLACAVAAFVIAQRTNSYSPDEAFNAGLLSYMGRLVLAVGVPDQYQAVLARSASPAGLDRVEYDVLGISHSEIGAALLTRWELPNELCRAVAEFRNVTPASYVTSATPLIAILHVADLVSEAIVATSPPQPAQMERILGAADFFLRVDDQTWVQIFKEISLHWQQFGAPSASTQARAASTDTGHAAQDRPRPTLPGSARTAAPPREVKSLGELRPQSRTPAPEPEPSEPQVETPSAFVPRSPQTLQEAGLTADDVEMIICKLLLAKGSHAGRTIAEHLGLPFGVVEPLLVTLKNDLILAYKNSAPFNDYEYELTDVGRERARRYLEECTYFGTAPVPLRDYIAGVQAQSLTACRVGETEVRTAFGDLCIPDDTLYRIGRAVNSGRGMFLYGSPGNGKTSIAERITGCFGTEIWIPRTLSVDGEILRLFDPAKHEEIDQGENAPLQEERIDRRWVKVRRPTIVSGGELTMAELEVQHNPVTKVSEAPLQLKSNCGALVIDDFGRQRISTDQLLNRWIVPLEKRHDFLNLANGKKIQVPFDQLIIFSTNLEPRDLVDEAFLRRIPYKIQVHDPTPEEFATIFDQMRSQLGFPENADAFEYLVDRHFQQAGRPLRCCHPRDLLLQVRNDCAFRDAPLELTRASLDAAIEDYFAIM